MLTLFLALMLMGSYLSCLEKRNAHAFLVLKDFWSRLSCIEKCNAHAFLVLKGFWSREASVLTKIKAAKFYKKKRKEI